MKRIISLVFPFFIAITAFFYFYSKPVPKEKIIQPPPIETIIVEKEDSDHHQLKQEWIEEMHRSAPEDNWRLMDQMYRAGNQVMKKSTNELPVYGKWKELGSNNQAGRTVYTWYDTASEEVYTAADGGQIWKGIAGEDNWQSINDHFRIPAIRFMNKLITPDYTRLLVHSSVYNTIGIMYSDDDGQNWTLASGLDNIASWGYIKRTIVQKSDPKIIYCVAQEWDYNAWEAVSKIYKSEDLGESFEVIATLGQDVKYSDIWTSPMEEGPIYVIDNNELFYLDDDDNLVSISTIAGAESGKSFLTGFDSGSGQYLYVMIRANNLSYFYASGINGADWQETGSHSQGPFMINSFAASIVEQDVLYFGGIEAFSSSNAGASWNLVNGWGQYYGSPEDKLHADIPSFNSFLDEFDDEILFINTDGGTYVSYDQMENVDNISLNNLLISQYYSSYTCRFDPSVTHAGSQDQGYQRSLDGMSKSAIDYDQLISGDYSSMVSGDDGASIWMVYPGFAMYGPNINNTNSLILSNFVGSNYQWIPKLMDDPDDPENVYLAGGHITTGAHIMHLERTGNSISYSELPYDFSNGTGTNISALVYSQLDHDYWYVFTAERDFFYSEDGGTTWSQTEAFEGPESHFFFGASIEPAYTDLSVVYIAGSGYSNPGVYRSSDNGEAFTSFSDGLPSSMVYDIAISPDDSLLFAATAVGPFVCKIWEEQWYSLGDSIVPDQAYWDIDYVDTLKIMRYSSYGRGIWDFELDPDVQADFMADQTSITTNETVDFYDLSSFAPISWDWYFEGASPESSNEQNPSGILYEQTGNFDVRLIVSSDQSTDTLLKGDYITVGTVGITGASDQNPIVIFPNPASEYIYVNTNELTSQINIFNISGVLVKSVRFDAPSQSSSKIDIHDLKPGVYFVKTNKNSELVKLVVQ